MGFVDHHHYPCDSVAKNLRDIFPRFLAVESKRKYWLVFPLVVVGGSAIEFLTEGAYASGDLDMCPRHERDSAHPPPPTDHGFVERGRRPAKLEGRRDVSRLARTSGEFCADAVSSRGSALRKRAADEAGGFARGTCTVPLCELRPLRPTAAADPLMRSPFVQTYRPCIEQTFTT